jgi:poly-gamma-glutamate capsule biosynthesis protein CapA/YwtB (metallophosphatase superfamily)
MRFVIVLIPLFLVFCSITNGISKDGEFVEPIPIVSIAAVGDIMMGTTYPSAKLPEEGGRLLFKESKEILKKADIAFGNLEGPLCDGGSPAKDMKHRGSYIFRTPTRFAKNLVDAGFNVISLANNHAEDFGPKGVSSTKKVLDRAGIRYSSKAGEVAEFDIKGVKVGLVAVSFGPPPRSIVNPREALAEIDLLSKKYNLLIVSVHGGKEGTSALRTRNELEYFIGKPRGNLIQFAHGAIDRGADLILGHGPHVPRAIEVYQKRLIAYSLGNFCTYGRMSLNKEEGYAPMLWAELSESGEFIRGKLYSFVQVPPGGPKKDEKERAWTLIKKLSQEDFPGTSPFFGLSEMIPR